MRRILVTGGGGYVGSVLVKKLLGAGYYVTVWDRFLFGDRLGIHRCLKRICGDIRDPAARLEALEDVDAVIHLAAFSNDASSSLDPELTRAVNETASIELIAAAASSGVQRFIFASTSSVYGNRDEANVTEDLPIRPLTLYTECKANVERYLFEQDSFDMTCVAIRSATVYGLSPRMRLDLLVNGFVYTALQTGLIHVHGGLQYRALVHIDDLVDLYERFLNYPTQILAKEAFNVTEANYTVLEVAKKISEISSAKIEITELRDFRSYRLCGEKLMYRTGWKARHKLEKYLPILINSLKSINLDVSTTDNASVLKSIDLKALKALPPLSVN